MSTTTASEDPRQERKAWTAAFLFPLLVAATVGAVLYFTLSWKIAIIQGAILWYAMFAPMVVSILIDTSPLKNTRKGRALGFIATANIFMVVSCFLILVS